MRVQVEAELAAMRARLAAEEAARQAAEAELKLEEAARAEAEALLSSAGTNTEQILASKQQAE